MIRPLAFLALITFPALAFADDPAVEPKAAAKAHVARAMALHKAGEHADAFVELKAAYELDPQPQLLFALGQESVQLGRCPDAIAYYEQYLATKPSTAQQNITREAIDACKTTAPTPPPEPAPPTEPTPAPTPAPAAAPLPVPAQPHAGHRAWYSDKLGVGLAAGGLVTGIVGIVMYTGARSDRDEADSAPTYDEYVSLVDRAHTKQTTALVLGVAGTALVAAGGIHIWMHGKDETVVVAPTAGGAAVSWSGSW